MVGMGFLSARGGVYVRGVFVRGVFVRWGFCPEPGINMSGNPIIVYSKILCLRTVDYSSALLC